MIKIHFIVLGLGAALLAGCDDCPDTEAILALTGDPDVGASVFSSCSSTICHGDTGNNGPADMLSSAVPELDDEELAATIACGVGEMPEYAGSNQEIADVIAYVRATYK